MKKLAVIIVAYRGVDILLNCLDSVFKYNDIGEELEVIVSDNSPDNSVVNLLREKYPVVRVLKNDNIGFGAGNNRGEAVCESEFLLFLNPDTVLVEPIFAFALKKFEDENLALFGLRLIGLDGGRRASFFLIDSYGIFSTICDKFDRKFDRFRDGKAFICGADIFVRRQSFIEAGRFDEAIFMYKEEADLIKRIKLYSTAKKTAFFKQKKIIHLEGGTQADDADKVLNVRKRLTESDIYYCKKWGIDAKKVIKARLRYIRLKKLLYFLMFRRSRVQEQTVLSKYYSGVLKTLHTVEAK